MATVENRDRDLARGITFMTDAFARLVEAREDFSVVTWYEYGRVDFRVSLNRALGIERSRHVEESVSLMELRDIDQAAADAWAERLVGALRGMRTS